MTTLLTSTGPTLKEQYKTPFSRIPWNILRRLCVTQIDKSSQQEFTYRPICQASTVFMHHLVEGGMKRSEVFTAHTYYAADVSFAGKGILEAEYASQVS